MRFAIQYPNSRKISNEIDFSLYYTEIVELELTAFTMKLVNKIFYYSGFLKGTKRKVLYNLPTVSVVNIAL